MNNPNERSSSESSTSYASDEKYATNGGIIEGIWIFHRHGDRTPSSPLVAEHLIESDAAFWQTKLPDTSVVEAVAHRFPKQIYSSSSEKYLDGKREPYGFLTRVGTSQMYNAGRRFFLRYNRLGKKRNLASGEIEPNNLLNHWDVTAYSTNYLRTITSAQFFLEGLLHSEAQPSASTQSRSTIPINVRSRDIDTLNAFDKNPEKMLSLVSEVVATPGFQARDALALPLATLLTDFLPGLMTGKKTFFGGPSGINWIHATDHFVCREAHGVKLTTIEGDKNVSLKYDPRLEESMQALAHSTKTHLAWRFQQWFSHSSLLSAIAVPPLREVEQELKETPHLPSNVKRPLKIFSCHDVTILSLLYGVGASTVTDDERYWPPYATTLAFELVRKMETDEFVVRVLLNGKPVEIKKSKRKLIPIDEFSEIVDNLQIKGGIDDEFIDTDAMERDMAGWTG